MNLEISLVPYGMLTRTVGSLMKYLTIAEGVTDGRSIVDDLVKFFYMGHYSLWVIFDIDAKALVGFFALEVKQYPQKRMMCIQHCTTEPGCMEAGFSRKMQDVLERYGRDQGCGGIEFVGRAGWQKKFANECGYTVKSIVMETALGEVPK